MMSVSSSYDFFVSKREISELRNFSIIVRNFFSVGVGVLSVGTEPLFLFSSLISSLVLLMLFWMSGSPFLTSAEVLAIPLNQVEDLSRISSKHVDRKSVV